MKRNAKQYKSGEIEKHTGCTRLRQNKSAIPAPPNGRNVFL